MAAVAVVRLEGVLSMLGDERPFMETESTPDGLRLVAALMKPWHVVILHSQQDHLASHWVQTRATGVAREVSMITSDENRARSLGHPDLWVTGDPEDAARAMADGITTLLIARPVYTRGEMRPDTPPTVEPWGAVVDEMERQRLMFAADTRGREEH